MVKEPLWKRNVKKNYLKIKDYDLRIELAKYKLNQKWGLFKWVLGIGIGLLASAKFFDLTSSSDKLIFILGNFLYVIGFLMILASIIIHILDVNLNLKALEWLYQQKDKANKKPQK